MEGSENPNVAAGKPVQKRAATACLRCRSRKVRCDLILQEGASCTNCRLDALECIVKVGRRHRQTSSLTGNLDLLSHSELVSAEGHNHGSQIICMSASLEPMRSKDIYNLTPGLDQIGDRRPASPINDTPLGHKPNPPFSKNSAVKPSYVSGASKSESMARESRSHFKPPPSTMDAEDVEYLKLKGAFSVPSGDLRYQLLQSYLNFVHPYNPVLDIQDVYAMEERSDIGQVSYLLFQAVMLGGSLFVEQKHLAQGGYSTRKAARQNFYEKARVLYERDYEQDRLLIAQALLLMSLWYETPNSHKNCWYWSGLAIGLIKSTDINKVQDSTETEKWRRLWWSAFVRDRLIALGMKLPIRFRIEDYKVKMLDRDDFSLDEWSPNFLQGSENFKLSWKTGRAHQLFIMYIEEVKLCICMDRFLRVLRAEERSFESAARELEFSEKELQDWLLNLPQEARFDLKCIRETDPVLTVHQAVLCMLHLCAFAFVQRAYLTMLVPRSQPSSPKSLEVQITARANIRSTAGTMAETAQFLREKDLVRYLPHSAVISFIHSMRAMEVFRDSYFDTDYGTRLVNSVFERESVQSVPVGSEPEAGSRDIPTPVTSLPEVSIPGNDFALNHSPSHEWIVGELAAFIDSASSTWDTWQQEVRDPALPSQLEVYQPGISPTEMARGDLALDVPSSSEPESLSTTRISDRNQHISLRAQEDYSTNPSTDWPANSWPIELAPKDVGFDYQMDFDQSIL